MYWPPEVRTTLPLVGWVSGVLVVQVAGQESLATASIVVLDPSRTVAVSSTAFGPTVTVTLPVTRRPDTGSRTT